ncbi:hypothetical protein U1Q18_044323, partial [Sarracenia purpurea var. burkii]
GEDSEGPRQAMVVDKDNAAAVKSWKLKAVRQGEQPLDGVLLEENLYGAGWAGEKGEVHGRTAEPSTGGEGAQ